MRHILTLTAFLAAMFLAMAAVGCQASPGGLHVQSDGKGGWVLDGAGDVTLQEANVKAPDGTVFSVKGYTRNSSNLAAINAPVLIQQSNNATAIAAAVIGLVQSGAIVIPGVTGGGGTVTPTTDLTALKATLTARIDACPFLATNPALRDKLKAEVAAVNTQAGADVLQKIVDDLYAQTPAPAAVKGSK